MFSYINVEKLYIALITLIIPQFQLLFISFKYTASTGILILILYIVEKNYVLKIIATNAIKENTRGIKVGRGEIKNWSK